MPAPNRPLCHHARLLQLVARRISQILADEYAPNMKGYALARAPKMLAALEGAIVETQNALPKETRGVLAPDELDRLSLSEVMTVSAMLARAGCKPDNPERGCVCEEREKDLAALTRRIGNSLAEDHITLHNLLGLGVAALELHKGLGLVPSTTEDGTDWSTFSTKELFYLDAVVRKAKGEKLKPPTHGVKCAVCGYSTNGPGDLESCPVGCVNTPAVDDADPIFDD